MRNKLTMAAAAALLIAGQAAAADYLIDNLTARYGADYNWIYINNAGELAGKGADGALALRLRSGSATYRDDSAAASWLSAFGNDGTLYFGGYTQAEVFWSKSRAPDGMITATPDLIPDQKYGPGVDDVNDSGIAVGRAYGSGYKATVFQDGKAIALGAPGHSSAATGINNQGVVVGYYSDWSGIISNSFIYANGKFGTLGTGYIAYEVNDANLVAGNRLIDNADPSTGNYQSAFLWQDGVTTDISIAGKRYSRMIDLNNSGVLVGAAWHWDDSPEEFFIYADGETILLNDILAAEGYSGWNVLGISDINDNGQILAHVYSEASGIRVERELLLSPALPVPEPGTWAMLLAGLGCVGMLKRRRNAAA